jgi:hypothetical protein
MFAAVAAANAAMSYAYTKDVILSPAGAFFAVAFAVAARSFIESMRGVSLARATAAGLLLLVLSGAWAFRAVNAHLGLRVAAAAVRTEWAYVDMWLERKSEVPTDPFAVELKRRLQDEAVRKHPARSALTGDWLAWFGD